MASNPHASQHNARKKMSWQEKTSGKDAQKERLRLIIQMRRQERASKHEIEMKHGTARERAEMDEILNPSSEKWRREEDEIEDLDFEAAVNKLRNEARQSDDQMRMTNRRLKLRIDNLMSGLKSRLCAGKRLCLVHMKKKGITLREYFKTVKSLEKKEVVL